MKTFVQRRQKESTNDGFFPDHWQSDQIVRRHADQNMAKRVFDDGRPSPDHCYNKKFTRYTYRSSSSYQSSGDNEPDATDHLPKKLRNPLGETHDYQNMSKEYGDHLLTNIASPEKCHELSNILSSDKEAEKSVELFHKRRQRSEQFIVNERSGNALPPVAPPKKSLNAKDDVDAVIETESNDKPETDLKRPIESPGSAFRPPLGSHRQATEQKSSSRVIDAHNNDAWNSHAKHTTSGRQTPIWDHERLFSPVPFNSALANRSFTPVPTDFMSTSGRFQQTSSAAHSQASALTRPEPTASYGNMYSTLPRGWKSLSQI